MLTVSEYFLVLKGADHVQRAGVLAEGGESGECVGGEQGGRKASGRASSEAGIRLDIILVSGKLNFPQEVHLPSAGSTSLKNKQR